VSSWFILSLQKWIIDLAMVSGAINKLKKQIPSLCPYITSEQWFSQGTMELA